MKKVDKERKTNY